MLENKNRNVLCSCEYSMLKCYLLLTRKFVYVHLYHANGELNPAVLSFRFEVGWRKYLGLLTD